MGKTKTSKDHTIKILDTLLVISVLALIVLVTPLILAQLGNDGNPESMEEVINSCSDLSLKEAGQCAVENTRNFYQYNLENIGTEISFSELVEEGGVCSNWSHYYTELGESLGYNTEDKIIRLSGNLYHEFSVWSNEESYCILDQTELSCFELGNSVF